MNRSAPLSGTSAASVTVDSVADAIARPSWLDLAGHRDLPPRAPVADGAECELLVVGAGLTGLWAAREAAALGDDVLVVDAGTIGGGASGRCGGFINASITHGIPHGHSRWPDEMPAVVALQEAVWDDTLGLLAAAGAADVVEPFGKLTVATTQPQLEGLAAGVDVLRRYGQEVHELGRSETRAVANSPTYLGGYHHVTANGVCDPVRLADAIARMAADFGARLSEHSAVVSIDPDRRGARDGRLIAHLGDGRRVTARRVLLATNAYRPIRRQLRWRMIPVYDHVITTEPLTGPQREAVGWERPVGITDAGNRFHYYRLTPDGRILFGGWDATYHFGGRVDEALEVRDSTHRLLAQHLIETFPALEGISISHRWGGPIDSTSRFTPMFGTALGGRLGWALGFTGLGVGASRFAALASLDLLRGEPSERTALSMVRRAPIPFPPEPLRWPVIQVTKRALAREDETGRRGLWLRFLDRLGVGFDT